jgi:cytochrome c5
LISINTMAVAARPPTEDFMSDNSHDQHEDHTGPVKTPKQMLLLSLASFVIPVFIIIGLVYYVTSANKPAAGAVDVERATAQRIQKIGMVEVRDANRPLKSGEEVYKAQCLACHDSGAAGAPKFGVAGAWSARLGQGLQGLVNSALKGKGAMGAQGGGDFNDTEIARAVVYLANSAGGKFEEPKAPEAVPK